MKISKLRDIATKRQSSGGHNMLTTAVHRVPGIKDPPRLWLALLTSLVSEVRNMILKRQRNELCIMFVLAK